MYILRCTPSRFVFMPASVTVLQPSKVPQGTQRTALLGTLAVHTFARGSGRFITCCYTHASSGLLQSPQCCVWHLLLLCLWRLPSRPYPL